MTGKELLAKEEWAPAMKKVFKDLVFKAQKDTYDKYCKQMAAKEKAREKEPEKARKEVEKQQKEIEKFQVQEEKQRQKA